MIKGSGQLNIHFLKFPLFLENEEIISFKDTLKKVLYDIDQNICYIKCILPKLICHQLNLFDVLYKLRELVMDREVWNAAVCGVTKSQICLND